jgi:hypothetical protein
MHHTQGDNASVTPLLECSRQLEFQEYHFVITKVFVTDLNSS